MATPDTIQGSTFKDFQLSATNTDKKDVEYGKIIAKHIYNTTLGPSGHIAARNLRFARNRQWYNGRINIQEMFQALMGFDGDVRYTNLSWKAMALVNTIVSRLVGRWMTRNEKISVTATDTLSIYQKNEEYEEIEFELIHRQMLAQLEAESGVPLTNKDRFQPADKEELELWRAELQRLPEEILYETNTNDCFAANGWFDVLKEKGLTDAACTGLVGTFAWMDQEGVIHVDPVKPENAFYSASEYPDFRDTAWRGQVLSLKISDIRRKYGKQYGGTLTEEKLFDLAATAKEYRQGDLLTWLADWDNAFTRPYDEWNVDVIDFELKSLDSTPYTITQTEKNKSTILKKGKPEKIKDNQEYVEDKKWVIYRGVYARNCDIMLEWGLKKNMIRPQDPKESGNVEFSYSFYMYQMADMRNMAIPEKIEAPVEALLLTQFKIQHIIANMIPPGAKINVDAMQELQLGLPGGPTTPMAAQKIWQQTGKLYYRGRDAEGNPIPVPIEEMQNSGFLAQLQGLIALYQFQFGTLKDELGEDPNLMTQAATPRVTAGNIQTSLQQSDNATGYIYDAFVRVMEETAKKVACLMHKSVKYGSRAYRNIMKAENVADRVFGTKMQLLPQEAEIQNLYGMLMQAVAATPDLVMYMDVFKIMRLAKENIKLAELLFQQCQKKMLRDKAEQASKNAQENAQIQVQSAQSKAQGDAQLKQLEGDLKLQQTGAQGDSASRNTVLAGIMKMYEIQQTNGLPLPPELRSLAVATLETVAIPAMIQNEQQRQAIIAQMQNDMAAEQQQQQQQPPPEQMGQEQPQLGAPQPQLAAV